MQDNVDRELQIELTKLQIKYEHEIAEDTVRLSVILSLMVTMLSVYVPLSVITGNLVYTITPAASLFLYFPLIRVWNHMQQLKRQSETDFQELKKKYLW